MWEPEFRSYNQVPVDRLEFKSEKPFTRSVAAIVASNVARIASTEAGFWFRSQSQFGQS